MIFELAIVEDRGTFYQVIGVIKSSLDNLANREDKMLKLTYNSYLKIKTALDDNRNVTISKVMLTDEVLPDEVMVSDDVVSEIDVYKTMAFQKINKKLTYKAANLSTLSILSFGIANNELLAAGHVITNANREAKYIEIIESEDEALIASLEKYLNLLDDVEKVSNFEKVCTSYINKIKNANTTGAIDKLIEEFYETINAIF